MRREDVRCFTITMILCLLCLCAYTIFVFSEPQTSPAKDLKANVDQKECDFSYLGIYQVENFGKMELFCENGEYFGEISGVFSIAMTEMNQKDWFRTVFCLEDTCYAHPTTILDGVLEDVYGKYVRAEVVK